MRVSKPSKCSGLHHILRFTFSNTFFNIKQYNFMRQFFSGNIISTGCTNGTGAYNSNFHCNIFYGEK